VPASHHRAAPHVIEPLYHGEIPPQTARYLALRARALSGRGRPAWRPARVGLRLRQAGRHSGRPRRPGDADNARAL